MSAPSFITAASTVFNIDTERIRLAKKDLQLPDVNIEANRLKNGISNTLSPQVQHKPQLCTSLQTSLRLSPEEVIDDAQMLSICTQVPDESNVQHKNGKTARKETNSIESSLYECLSRLQYPRREHWKKGSREKLFSHAYLALMHQEWRNKASALAASPPNTDAATAAEIAELISIFQNQIQGTRALNENKRDPDSASPKRAAALRATAQPVILTSGRESAYRALSGKYRSLSMKLRKLQSLENSRSSTAKAIQRAALQLATLDIVVPKKDPLSNGDDTLSSGRMLLSDVPLEVFLALEPPSTECSTYRSAAGDGKLRGPVQSKNKVAGHLSDPTSRNAASQQRLYAQTQAQVCFQSLQERLQRRASAELDLQHDLSHEATYYRWLTTAAKEAWGEVESDTFLAKLDKEFADCFSAVACLERGVHDLLLSSLLEGSYAAPDVQSAMQEGERALHALGVSARNVSVDGLSTNPISREPAPVGATLTEHSGYRALQRLLQYRISPNVNSSGSIASAETASLAVDSKSAVAALKILREKHTRTLDSAARASAKECPFDITFSSGGVTQLKSSRRT